MSRSRSGSATVDAIATYLERLNERARVRDIGGQCVCLAEMAALELRADASVVLGRDGEDGLASLATFGLPEGSSAGIDWGRCLGEPIAEPVSAIFGAMTTVLVAGRGPVAAVLLLYREEIPPEPLPTRLVAALAEMVSDDGISDDWISDDGISDDGQAGPPASEPSLKHELRNVLHSMELQLRLLAGRIPAEQRAAHDILDTMREVMAKGRDLVSDSLGPNDSSR